MKLLGIGSLLCVSAALISTSLFGQVIFQPSLTNCKKPWSNGSFRFCAGTAVTVPFNAVTSTSSKYLVSLPINNTLSYRLYCPAVPNSTPVVLSSGVAKQTLLASSTALAESTQQTVGYASLSGATYTFEPKINFDATYAGNCKMEILSNLSIPNVDMLRTIVDLLKVSFADLDDLKSSINAAAELPAKWVAISDAPATIDGLVDGLENEIAIFQQELDALKSVDPATLTAADKASIEELVGIIESYQSMVNDLKRLKADLGDVATIASQCQADVQNVFCVDNVTRISKTIEASLAVKKGDLVEINTFLQSESDRLKATSLSISNALKRLISK